MLADSGADFPHATMRKNTTLNLLARLVNRPLSAANISTPSLFRTVGDEHEPRQFSTWAPKAIAAISKLPGTITDRSIVISLRRKLPGDRVTRLTRQHHFQDLRAQVARWVIDHADEIRASNPDIPEELNDRAADSWRPLLALADLMGGQWPAVARQAARALSGARDEEASGVLLLSDIQTIFHDKNTDRIPSKVLAEALGAIEGRPWAEYRNGKPITANQLARVLNDFGISPAPTRSGDDIFKGYVLDKFSDVFERYLQNAPLGGNQTVTRLPPNAGAGCNRVTAQKGGEGRFDNVEHPGGDEVLI